MKSPIKQKVPAVVAVVIIGIAIASVGLIGWTVITAPEPEHKFAANECTTCHSDAKTLAKMKEKRGDF